MGLSMSSHRYPLVPGASIETVHGGSPMSFGLPAGDEPDLILDMATHLTTGLDTEEMFGELPASFRKSGFEFKLLKSKSLPPRDRDGEAGENFAHTALLRGKQSFS